MTMRWPPSASLDAEKRFRRILGYRHLWTLKAILDEKQIDEDKKAAYDDGAESSPTTFNYVWDSIARHGGRYV